MTDHIKKEKSIPPDIDSFCSPDDKKLIPSEMECHYCKVALSEPKLVTRRAKLVSLTEKPHSDYMVYIKVCNKCHTPYKYQDYDIGIYTITTSCW